MKGPTQRSLAHLRALGYTVYIVEHFNMYAKVRRDLFGFIDIVAIHPLEKGVLGVQTTTGSNLAARIKKAAALPEYALWLNCGNRVEFHGWAKKLKNGRGTKARVWCNNILRVDLSDLL